MRHPKGRHDPPDDIGANFYPKLGAYSSADREVIDAHMYEIRKARIGKNDIYMIQFHASTTCEIRLLLSIEFESLKIFYFSFMKLWISQIPDIAATIHSDPLCQHVNKSSLFLPVVRD